MRLRDRLALAVGAAPAEQRSVFDEWLQYYSVNGNRYPMSFVPQGPPGVPSEANPTDFAGMVAQVYQRSGVVAACITARMMLLSEARFKFRNLDDRSIFGGRDLLPLERPTPNATSGDILARFEQDASLAGNAYRVRIGRELHRVDPGWMHIVLGSNMAAAYEVADAPDATVVGYAYWPHGHAGKYDPMIFLPSEVAHYAPIPDPSARFRGVSWLTSILRTIDTDRQLTEHKAGYLERGATPSFAIKYPEEVTRGDQGAERAKTIIDMFKQQHEGAANSWKALHLFGGADPVTIGSNFRDLDYKAIVGAGETTIAMAARVPASVLGISEGLAGSALNAGNFGQARRQFGEQYAYPSLRMACEALSTLVNVPSGAELWYDLSDVAFLREDAKDAADVIAIQATAIRTLIDGGMDADTAVKSVTGGDLSMLQHTGMVPVQLQPPGVTSDKPSAPAPTPKAGS